MTDTDRMADLVFDLDETARQYREEFDVDEGDPAIYLESMINSWTELRKIMKWESE